MREIRFKSTRENVEQVKLQIVAKMMWKAYMQLKGTPQKLDWQYAEEMELMLEKDFRRDISWEKLLHEFKENSK